MPRQDGTDVRFSCCITCGEPSKEGLCERCMRGPGPHLFAPSEDYGDPRISILWTERGRRDAARGCTCDECLTMRGPVKLPRVRNVKGKSVCT